jgi:hypothetical protein
MANGKSWKYTRNRSSSGGPATQRNRTVASPNSATTAAPTSLPARNITRKTIASEPSAARRYGRMSRSRR